MTLTAIHHEMRARRIYVFDKSIVWHQRLIAVVLLILSLGMMRGYLTSVVTTVGRRIYVPRAWGSWPLSQRADILRHELVHVRQWERWGPLLWIGYLLIPLPIGLAWCRMRIERAAYEESIRAAFERGGRAATDAMRASIVEHFVGPAYLWMWPFRTSVERWFDVTVEQLDDHDQGQDLTL